MLSKELELTLNVAFNDARSKRHEYMTVEHLLLALLDNSQVYEVLKSCGADIERLRSDLILFIDETTPLINAHEMKETQPTMAFQRVLQRAVFYVQSAGRSEVTGSNVLAAIFSEQDSQAVYFLKQENVTRLDVVNTLAQSQESFDISQDSEDLEDMELEASFEEDDDASSYYPLEKYAVNLNRRAAKGHVDSVISREKEVKRLMQVLCRRRKNNPLLVGEAGVGKTAIAEGLAQLINDGKVPDELKECIVYSLDLGSLLAGTKYRGDFEKRLKGLLQEVKKNKKAILFIDEIHTIIGAGAASGGVMDASNLIKPKLASGELRCIGATTYHEFRTIFEKDRALTRRFQKVDIKEPTEEQTLKILKGLRPKLEEHHSIKISDAALKTSVSLSKRFITDRFLPDKAIDLVDEASALQVITDPKKRKSLITSREIEEVIAATTQLPLQNISRSEKNQLKNLDNKIKEKIFGQDEAIDASYSVIKLARSGLRDIKKPIANLVFAGPTGVGKTELTKQLAEELSLKLVRFDMSEYSEKHTLSRLIGAPPGYVGHESGGLLTEEIYKSPHSIVLLDEIEKAHPDIYPVLLQVMDHGTLTDGNGRKVDFRHVILIMTTNAGASVYERGGYGFTHEASHGDFNQEIKKLFAPEFRNRLDAVIHFKPLEKESVRTIVRKEIQTLSKRLSAKNIQLECHDDVISWLAEKGYDKKMGARPIERTVKEKIASPLADEVLFGELSSGGKVIFSIENEELDIKILNKEELKSCYLPLTKGSISQVSTLQ
jgi:ATP-dependent Clp protease ATP-binding subunit ClpA